MRIPTREEIRQICDQRFSPEVYEKMQAASAAIAGLGGLGSNIAVMLARTGIGRSTISGIWEEKRRKLWRNGCGKSIPTWLWKYATVK